MISTLERESSSHLSHVDRLNQSFREGTLKRLCVCVFVCVHSSYLIYERKGAVRQLCSVDKWLKVWFSFLGTL